MLCKFMLKKFIYNYRDQGLCFKPYCDYTYLFV